VKKILVLIFILCFTAQSFGQDANTSTSKSGPRRQLATIVFAGLGGAVLGLSTLSFYGRPQDNLSNIGIGFAAGVIIGTIFVTYKAATTHDYDSAQEKRFQFSPMITQVKKDDSALGGQFALRF
jgi:hypothetical protein